MFPGQNQDRGFDKDQRMSRKDATTLNEHGDRALFKRPRNHTQYRHGPTWGELLATRGA